MMAAAAGAGAAECAPVAPPRVALRVEAVTPSYRASHSHAQLAAMAGTRLPRNHDQQGLTRAEAELTIDPLFTVIPAGRGRNCIAVSQLNAQWRLRRLEVELARENPPGSCARQVTLAHENRHVAIAQTLFAKYAQVLRQDLEQAALRLSPIASAQSPTQVGRELTRQVSTVLAGNFQAFQRELAAANAQLDTPESYRAETAKCSDWR